MRRPSERQNPGHEACGRSEDLQIFVESGGGTLGDPELLEEAVMSVTSTAASTLRRSRKFAADRPSASVLD